MKYYGENCYSSAAGFDRIDKLRGGVMLDIPSIFCKALLILRSLDR